MSIRTSSFGGASLSGKDADRFREAIKEVKPNEPVMDALLLGREMVKRLETYGRFVFKVTKRS